MPRTSSSGMSEPMGAILPRLRQGDQRILVAPRPVV